MTPGDWADEMADKYSEACDHNIIHHHSGSSGGWCSMCIASALRAAHRRGMEEAEKIASELASDYSANAERGPEWGAAAAATLIGSAAQKLGEWK